MAYSNAVAPNKVLAVTNTFAVDCGAPALASANRIVASHAMQRAAQTIANASSADGLPRNVTVTATQVGGVDDTGAGVLITGTDVTGAVITETITPTNGSTVAGTKAFATVTSVTQPAWVAGGTADTMTVGFGTLVGLPAAVLQNNRPFSAANEIFAAFLGGAAVTPTVTYNAAISGCTIDASSGTYDGTKKLIALMIRE